jgi:hypothetical protein
VIARNAHHPLDDMVAGIEREVEHDHVIALYLLVGQ